MGAREREMLRHVSERPVDGIVLRTACVEGVEPQAQASDGGRGIVREIDGVIGDAAEGVERRGRSRTCRGSRSEAAKKKDFDPCRSSRRQAERSRGSSGCSREDLGIRHEPVRDARRRQDAGAPGAGMRARAYDEERLSSQWDLFCGRR